MEAGGKGVNISRALVQNGVENLCLVVLGEENAEGFRRKLENDGIAYAAIMAEGRIRENITLHEKDADETRISFAGFRADASLLPKVEALLSEHLDEGGFVTFTGRVPEGLDMVDVKACLRRLQAKGAKIVIDSRSFSLSDLIEMRPWLIKPNQEEISAYLERPIKSLEETVAAAKDLYEKGIKNVMISLGAQGALLVSDEGVFSAVPPKIEALSTIGAGDSSIAGFLSAAVEGKNGEARLCRGVAYGTAACMTSGTRPPEAEDVKAVLPRIV